MKLIALDDMVTMQYCLKYNA